MIAWPPGRDVVLNVAGFEEAWASSVPVEVEDGFTERVGAGRRFFGERLLAIVSGAPRRNVLCSLLLRSSPNGDPATQEKPRCKSRCTCHAYTCAKLHFETSVRSESGVIPWAHAGERQSLVPVHFQR